MMTNGKPSCPFIQASFQRCSFAEKGHSLCKSWLFQPSSRLGPDIPKDHSLGPVGALMVYLAKTENRCQDKELHFI